MEEYLLKSSFDNEEGNNSDSSQESCINIVMEHHEEAFTFDWQSLKKACKLTTESDEEIDEFSESDDNFLENDDMMEVFEEDFEKPVFTNTAESSNINHYCIIVDYNDN